MVFGIPFFNWNEFRKLYTKLKEADFSIRDLSDTLYIVLEREVMMHLVGSPYRSEVRGMKLERLLYAAREVSHFLGQHHPAEFDQRAELWKELHDRFVRFHKTL